MMKRVGIALATALTLSVLTIGSAYGGAGWRGVPWRHGGHAPMMSYQSWNTMVGSQYQQAAVQQISLDQAVRQVRRFMARYDYPTLALDEVIEFQRNFYAIVKDRHTGHGAFEVLVDKWTGRVFFEYGPAMMWNTAYGMMGRGMMGRPWRSGPMSVWASRAKRIAQRWLARYWPGTTAEAPDQFPGYYTVHFRRHGTMVGMLSVNGYTGQVWYHNWHGKFIRMREF